MAQDRATKFIKSYCKVIGNGISFNKEEGIFQSWIQIEVENRKAEKDLDWWCRNTTFRILVSVETSIEVIEGKVTNTLSEATLYHLIKDGISEMRLYFNYEAECFDTMLLNLGISEEDCAKIMAGLLINKFNSIINKSLPVTQRAYDRWVKKGMDIKSKKEKVASVFGKDFLNSLEDGIKSFKEVYLKNKADALFSFFKRQYGALNIKTDSEFKAQAEEEAKESWPFWVITEVNRITDVLMRNDIGVCDHYKMNFDPLSLMIEGDIFGSTGKTLHFHTIFAGGYNIQCLHTRTLANILD